MQLELRLIEGGVDRGPLPSIRELDISPVFCDYGTLTFQYPADGKRFSLLRGKDELEVVPVIDGTRYDRLGAMVQEIEGDDVAEAAIHKYTGRMYLCLLDEGVVYPYNWPTYDPKDPTWRIPNATAGSLMRSLIQACQARGSLPGITTNFTNTNDSNGVAWNKTITLELKPGVSLTTVLKNLNSQGMCEFEMVGRELRMYNADTLTVDRTTGTNPLTFRKGRDLRDSPRKTTSRNIATVVLAAGKEDTGVYHEEVNAQAVAARRRIERFVSNGNVTDAGTLNAWSEIELARSSKPQMEKTHGLEFANAKSPRPLRNFNVGDWAFSDVGQGLERLRIKQWVLRQEANGKVSGSIVLNDLFAEISARLAARVEGIIGGTTITGESRAQDVVPGEIVDKMAPRTPLGLSLVSNAYSDTQGITYAQVSASWTQVTQNEDGTVLEDLGGYRVRWRYADETDVRWRYLEINDSTTTSWSPLQVGRNVIAHVQAFDRIGNASAWSTQTSITTATDATPPSQPAALTVNSWGGLLQLTYNGLNSTGGPMEADTDRYEIHVSNVDAFTPTASTRIDTLKGAGSSFAEVPYGSVRYARVVAVDRVGNRSTPSVTASGSTTPIVSMDIFDGAVGTAKLADLAVTTAKINDLAVNDAKVGSLNAAKIVTGVMNAVLTVSGRIVTATTGARTEFNAQGFYRFDAAGNTVVAVDSSGALLTGRYRTAISGRRLEMGSSGNLGEILFISQDGDQAFVRAYTEAGGVVEAIQIGLNVPASTNFLWNRININSDEWMNVRSRRIDLNFLPPQPASTNGFFYVRQLGNREATTDIVRLWVEHTFGVRDTNNYSRFIIDGNSTWFYDDQGIGRFGVTANGFAFWSKDFPEGNQNVFQYDQADDRFYFRPTGGTSALAWRGRAEIRSTFGDGNSSARFIQFTGEGFGGQIKFYRDTRGQWYETRDWNDTVFIGIRSANFEVNSDARDKEDIVEPGIASYLGKMKNSPKNFRRKKGAGPLIEATNDEPERMGAMAEENPIELGLIAQEMPDEVRIGTEENGFGIGTSQMMAFLWGAVRELAGRLDSVEGKVKAK